MAFYNIDISKALQRIQRKHPENYEIIEEFVSDLIANGISFHRINAYLLWLDKILDLIPKKLQEFERSDVRKVIMRYQMLCNDEKVSESTLYEVKKTLKKFFRWMGREDLIDWFSIGNVKSNISPSDLITEEEFRKILNACKNSRDRAIISLLYESGARIGEIGAMRIKDVAFDEYGAVVWLPKSKTKKRKLRVVFSASYLSAWIADHPLKDDAESPLWVKLTGRNSLKEMDYDDFRGQLKKICNRAGIKKRVHPHLFRHTRATKLLSQVSEVVGAKYMGWVMGSKMIKVYIHLADHDVEDKILEIYGIKPKNNGKDLEIKQCPRCLQVNPAQSRFCSRCGLPLTEGAIKEVEEWEKRKAEALNSLSDPQVLKLLMGMQREIDRLRTEIEKVRSESGGG